jgi:hypothetical protein
MVRYSVPLAQQLASVVVHDVEESQLAGVREGDLKQLFQAAGLHRIEENVLAIQDWWER